MLFQIPDVKSGKEKVDAVVVDAESVGSVSTPGCGGKILRGEGAFQRYLAEARLKDLEVVFPIMGLATDISSSFLFLIVRNGPDLLGF